MTDRRIRRGENRRMVREWAAGKIAGMRPGAFRLSGWDAEVAHLEAERLVFALRDGRAIGPLTGEVDRVVAKIRRGRKP